MNIYNLSLKFRKYSLELFFFSTIVPFTSEKLTRSLSYLGRLIFRSVTFVCLTVYLPLVLVAASFLSPYSHFSLSLHPSLSIHLYLCLSTHLSLHLPISLCLSTHLFLHPPISLCLFLSPYTLDSRMLNTVNIIIYFIIVLLPMTSADRNVLSVVGKKILMRARHLMKSCYLDMALVDF